MSSLLYCDSSSAYNQLKSGNAFAASPFICLPVSAFAHSIDLARFLQALVTYDTHGVPSTKDFDMSGPVPAGHSCKTTARVQWVVATALARSQDAATANAGARLPPLSCA